MRSWWSNSHRTLNTMALPACPQMHLMWQNSQKELQYCEITFVWLFDPNTWIHLILTGKWTFSSAWTTASLSSAAPTPSRRQHVWVKTRFRQNIVPLSRLRFLNWALFPRFVSVTVPHIAVWVRVPVVFRSTPSSSLPHVSQSLWKCESVLCFSFTINLKNMESYKLLSLIAIIPKIAND